MKEIDFQAIEKKWQKKWEEKKIFEVEVDKKKKKYFLTTPYPYISGSLHLGHGRAVIESDIIARYMRMKGANVLFPMAFHISGMPVLGISMGIKNQDKSMIDLYTGYVSAYVKDKKKVKNIVNSFSDPHKIVNFFIPKMIQECGQFGLSVDWRRSFTSGDFIHQKMVDWQFREYKEKNYLVQGSHPILYSLEDKSSMGEDDIVDGDTFPVDKTQFTLLKFKLKDKFLVAGTLRPETIFGQTNLWVNPKVDYFEAKVGNEIWVLSKECLEKLKYQRNDVVNLGKSKEKLIGQKVIAPGIHREIPVLPSRFVDGDVCTGIVTSVPSDAPYDYISLRELQENKEELKKYKLNLKEIEEIEIIPIIETKKYGDKAAVNIIEREKIFSQDDHRLELLTQEVYKEGFHNGFLNSNCGEYSGMSVSEAKEKMKKYLVRKGEADVMWETSRKAVSRSGGKIIVALLDNQWFLDFNAKGWKEKAFECLREIKLFPETMRKLFEDTFSWLDKRPCARKRGLGTQLPFDKEWMIESLSDSTIYMTLYAIANLIKKYKLQEKNLSKEFFDFVYLGKGEIKKVSEITGVSEKILDEIKESFEYWMPVDHRHTFQLHLSNHLSFMLFAFAGLFDKKYWPKKISFHGLVLSRGSKMSKSKGNTITLLNVKEKFGADVFRFYLTQSTQIEGTFNWIDQEAENAKSSLGKLFLNISEAIKFRKKGNVRALFVSKFNRLKKEANKNIELLKLREYDSIVVYDFLNMSKDAKNVMDSRELGAFYELIVKDWITLLSPICPHIAEELWEKIGGKGFVSLANWPEFDEKKIDEKLEELAKSVDKSVGDILNVIKIVSEKQNREVKKVYLYVIPNEIENYNSKLISRRVGKNVSVFAVNDKKKYDPEGKSSKAKSGKPGIYVE